MADSFSFAPPGSVDAREAQATEMRLGAGPVDTIQGNAIQEQATRDRTVEALQLIGTKVLSPELKKYEDAKFNEGMMQAASGTALLDIINNRPAMSKIFGEGASIAGARAYTISAKMSMLHASLEDNMHELRKQGPEAMTAYMTKMMQDSETGDVATDLQVRMDYIKRAPSIMATHAREHYAYTQEEMDRTAFVAMSAEGTLFNKLMMSGITKPGTVSDDDLSAARDRLYAVLAPLPGSDRAANERRNKSFILTMGEVGNWHVLNDLRQNGVMDGLAPKDRVVVERQLDEFSRKQAGESTKDWQEELVKVRADAADAGRTRMTGLEVTQRAAEINRMAMARSGNPFPIIPPPESAHLALTAQQAIQTQDKAVAKEIDRVIEKNATIERAEQHAWEMLNAREAREDIRAYNTAQRALAVEEGKRRAADELLQTTIAYMKGKQANMQGLLDQGIEHKVVIKAGQEIWEEINKEKDPQKKIYEQALFIKHHSLNLKDSEGTFAFVQHHIAGLMNTSGSVPNADWQEAHTLYNVLRSLKGGGESALAHSFGTKQSAQMHAYSSAIRDRPPEYRDYAYAMAKNVVFDPHFKPTHKSNEAIDSYIKSADDGWGWSHRLNVDTMMVRRNTIAAHMGTFINGGMTEEAAVKAADATAIAMGRNDFGKYSFQRGPEQKDIASHFAGKPYKGEQVTPEIIASGLEAMLDEQFMRRSHRRADSMFVMQINNSDSGQPQLLAYPTIDGFLMSPIPISGDMLEEAMRKEVDKPRQQRMRDKMDREMGITATTNSGIRDDKKMVKDAQGNWGLHVPINAPPADSAGAAVPSGKDHNIPADLLRKGKTYRPPAPPPPPPPIGHKDHNIPESVTKQGKTYVPTKANEPARVQNRTAGVNVIKRPEPVQKPQPQAAAQQAPKAKEPQPKPKARETLPPPQPKANEPHRIQNRKDGVAMLKRPEPPKPAQKTQAEKDAEYVAKTEKAIKQMEKEADALDERRANPSGLDRIRASIKEAAIESAKKKRAAPAPAPKAPARTTAQYRADLKEKLKGMPVLRKKDK